jgi:hypothetical protein
MIVQTQFPFGGNDSNSTKNGKAITVIIISLLVGATIYMGYRHMPKLTLDKKNEK